MSSIILMCDFSRRFSDKFLNGLNAAAVAGSRLNVFHVVNLAVAVDARELPAFSSEQLILKFLREQAEREFSILNKRLNRARVPVTFEVGFGVVPNRREALIPVL